MFKGNHTKLIITIIIILIFVLLILFFYFKYRNASNFTPLTQKQALELSSTSQANVNNQINNNSLNNEFQNYLYDLSLIEANLQLFSKIIVLLEGKSISENDVIQLKNTIEYVNQQFVILNNNLTQLKVNATNNQISILQTTINSINQNINKINPIVNTITGINIIQLKI